MVGAEPRPEDSRALSLALKLDRAGAGNDLSRRLRSLIGTENEGRLLAACAQADAMLELKAAQDAQREVKAVVPDEPSEPVTEPEDAPQEPFDDDDDELEEEDGGEEGEEAERPFEDEKAWSSAAHPRAPAGQSSGGQFVSQGSTGATAEGAKRKLGGKLTDASIREFQKAHGLTVDGKIGRQTAAALLGNPNASSIPVGPMTDKQKAALAKLSQQQLDRAVHRKPKKRPATQRAKQPAKQGGSSGGSGLNKPRGG